MGMFGLKDGDWSLRSEKDPRWNNSGRTKWLVSAGICPDGQIWINQCKKNFGDPPDDLTYSFFKD
jgi:hypothetical protein